MNEDEVLQEEETEVGGDAGTISATEPQTAGGRQFVRKRLAEKPVIV